MAERIARGWYATSEKAPLMRNIGVNPDLIAWTDYHGETTEGSRIYIATIYLDSNLAGPEFPAKTFRVTSWDHKSPEQKAATQKPATKPVAAKQDTKPKTKAKPKSGSAKPKKKQVGGVPIMKTPELKVVT